MTKQHSRSGTTTTLSWHGKPSPTTRDRAGNSGATAAQQRQKKTHIPVFIQHADPRPLEQLRVLQGESLRQTGERDAAADVRVQQLLDLHVDGSELPACLAFSRHTEDTIPTRQITLPPNKTHKTRYLPANFYGLRALCARNLVWCMRVQTQVFPKTDPLQ